MKYNEKNKPLVCMQTQSTCYKGTRTFAPKGVLWHCTGANNPKVSRYVQPSDNASNKAEMLKILGTNSYHNDWNHKSVQAGLNFWVGKLADGSVAAVQTMPWNYRPWGCGSGSKGTLNDTCIQFEMCEDDLTNKSYFLKCYTEGVEMTAYLCKMYGIDPMGTHTYNGVKVPNILCHYDSYHLGCGSNHGDVYNWFKKFGYTMDNVRNDVAKLLKGETTPEPTPAPTPVKTGLQATSLKNLSDADVIKKVGPLFTADQKKSGILASVSLAQFILESAYGKSELAQKANNCFGMKSQLSGNSWSGSVWDGSTYNKQTKEQNADGSYITITASFRKYPNIEDSIADHSAYLTSAMKGTELRYAGLKGCTDYKKAFQIIKNGGYATSLDYVKNLCAVVEKWNLTQYDVGEKVKPEPAPTPVKAVPSISFAVKTKSVKLPEAKNGGTVGNGEKIVGIRIGVTHGSVRYRVHCGGRWLPAVTGNNWNDFNNGYAGDDSTPIDAIQIYYTSDRNKTDVYEAVYSVLPRGWNTYLPDVRDTNWESGDGDHTAGCFGYPIGHLRLSLVKM